MNNWMPVLITEDKSRNGFRAIIEYYNGSSVKHNTYPNKSTWGYVSKPTEEELIKAINDVINEYGLKSVEIDNLDKACYMFREQIASKPLKGGELCNSFVYDETNFNHGILKVVAVGLLESPSTCNCCCGC